MASYCTVRGCSHSDSHNIQGHYCRKCEKYGHGISECGNASLINSLEVNTIPKDLQCNVVGCVHPANHTSKGHKCRSCGNFNHGWKTCKASTICPLCNLLGHDATDCMYTDPEDIAGATSGKIYVTIYEGMGCFSLHRRKSSKSKFQVFKMHSDDWGQYGSSSVPELKSFIEGYKPLRKVDDILNNM